MIRFILVFLIVLLILRAFVIAGRESRSVKPANGPDKEPWKFKKGIPKWLGEYTDYEEIENKRR